MGYQHQIVQRPAHINANKHMLDNLASFSVIKVKLMKFDFRYFHSSITDSGQRPRLLHLSEIPRPNHSWQVWLIPVFTISIISYILLLSQWGALIHFFDVE